MTYRKNSCSHNNEGRFHIASLIMAHSELMQSEKKIAATTDEISLTQPRLAQIAGVFLRYANFTLGGGSATIAVIHNELVDRRKWLSQENFTLCFALSRLTPGTNLLAFCAGIGWLFRRTSGAMVALLAASIPCAIVVVAATAIFSHWQSNNWAQAAIHGATAAAVAITVKSCWTIAHPHFKGRTRWRVVLISTIAFLLYVCLEIPAVEILLLAAVVGALLPTRS